MGLGRKGDGQRARRAMCPYRGPYRARRPSLPLEANWHRTCVSPPGPEKATSATPHMTKKVANHSRKLSRSLIPHTQPKRVISAFTTTATPPSGASKDSGAKSDAGADSPISDPVFKIKPKMKRHRLYSGLPDSTCAEYFWIRREIFVRICEGQNIGAAGFSARPAGSALWD
eukprot:scaffold3550_cov112-Isochrysis_galbana.AAC.12